MFLLVILLFSSFFQSVNVTTTLFLTSDNIGSNDNDVNTLNSIKEYIENMSNGTISVIVDDNAPNPGEGTRAIESSTDVSVVIAASCAGNFLIMADYTQKSDKKIIFVNMGDFDLDNASFIRRAWDDNYSGGSFAGINNPGSFLKTAGISYIQPLKQYPDKGNGGLYSVSNDEVNRYIAEEIINAVDNNRGINKVYDDSLIVNHELYPRIMATSSQKLVNSNDTQFVDVYSSYSAPQLLYLTSSYLNGNGLKEPSEYNNPNSPWKYSLFTKSTYTIYDYVNMASIVKVYMDETGQAPDYINYEGAYIGYYDLVYNFAKITENHTDYAHMGFDHSYSFEKVNSSIFIDGFPIFIGIIVLLIFYGIIRRIRRK